MFEPESQPSRPLAGLAVIEIGHSVAAPFAAQVLADLGALVAKIENPEGGDDARGWGPPFWGEDSATFQAINRNKLSVSIDLKDEADRKRLDALIDQADVVIQNLRPGLVDKFKIDAETVRKRNPGLIYCNLGAFGPVGPLRSHTGYDPLLQAFCGIMSVTGEAGRPPVRVGPSIIDMGTALWCVVGILAALARRQQTGEGVTVDTSLYEAGLAWMNIPLANTIASGRDTGKSGSETPMLAPYRAFMASDRYLVIAAGNDNLFRRFCDAIGHAEWATDERFRTNADRVGNRIVLNAMIDEIISQQSAAHWCDLLTGVGVPCAPVQSPSEVIDHPQTEMLGMLQSIAGEDMRLVATPLSFDGVRPDVRSKAPALGESNDCALELFRSRARWGDASATGLRSAI